MGMHPNHVMKVHHYSKTDVALNVPRMGRKRPGWFGAAACATFLTGLSALGADFTVASPGFFYSINGTGVNPTITLVRGKTYTFAVSASSFHPFLIQSAGVQ